MRSHIMKHLRDIGKLYVQFWKISNNILKYLYEIALKKIT